MKIDAAQSAQHSKVDRKQKAARMMKVQGACHCGDVSYEAIVDQARVSICHCTDCQALTGTAYRVTVPTLIKDFEKNSAKRITNGLYQDRRQRSKARASVLPRCGSPIYAHAVENPKTYGLRFGASLSDVSSFQRCRSGAIRR